MKKLLLAIFINLIITASFAAPVNTLIVNNGTWNSASSWSLGRQPSNGDIVVVPRDMTLVINSDVLMASQNIVIKIYGVFKLFNAVLEFGNDTGIFIYDTGSITFVTDGRITIGSSIKFDRTGTIVGVQFADKTTADEPYGFQPFSTLPVKFVGFTLTKTDNHVLVQWATAQEINVELFKIERSYDGANWSSLASVMANGNSNTLNNYKYLDKNIIAKVVYYRIKTIDWDGKSMYTSVKKLRTENGNSAVQIASVQNQVLLQFYSEIKGNVAIQFITPNGQLIEEQVIKNPVGQIVLSSRFRGPCIIAVSNDQSLHTAKQIIL